MLRTAQATSDKRQATSDKRQATSDKRQATSDKRQATSDKRQATSDKRQAISSAFVVLSLFLSIQAFATPQIVRVDGSIFDSAGAPFTGSKDIQIKAYDAASGGTLLWTSATTNTAVNSGRFTINMDAASGSSPSLVARIGERTTSQGIYFQIEVDSGAADGSMDSAQIVLPRIRAKGTMFALNAAEADSLRGVTATAAQINYLVGVTAGLQSQLSNLSSIGASGLATAGGTMTGILGLDYGGANPSTALVLNASRAVVSSTITSTELGYLSGATLGVQTQLNALSSAVASKASSSHTHPAGDIASGQLVLARGGTGADLSATGGSGQYLKQVSGGAAVSVGVIAAGDLPSGIDGAKITLGAITTAVLGTGTANDGTFLRGDGTWTALPGVPAGSIQAWGGASAPTGWLLCDGSAVSRTTYADLFAAIGTAFGSGDGSTTFNLPDFRGRFLRGVDGTAGRDPGDSSRTAMNSGGNTGDNVGSVQSDAFQGHYHNRRPNGSTEYTLSTTGGSLTFTPGGFAAPTFTSTGAPISDGTNGTPRTTSETRPINAYVNYIIKHTPAASSGTVTSADLTAFFNGVTANVQTQITAVTPQECNGRLTLTSGTPVTLTAVTGATSVYFTPFRGNRVALYDGSSWQLSTFSELSLSLSGVTSNTNHDIFIYNNSGTITLESVAWTDGTTRATGLTTQDGVYVKSGTPTKRYVGTYRTTATVGQTEDSESRRFLWNACNRTTRRLKAAPTGGNWTYTSQSWRSAGAVTTVGETRVELVQGLAEDLTRARISVLAQHGTAGTSSAVGIAFDSTSTTNCDDNPNINFPVANIRTRLACSGDAYLSNGYHYVQWTEYGPNSGTTTWITGTGALIVDLPM